MRTPKALASFARTLVLVAVSCGGSSPPAPTGPRPDQPTDGVTKGPLPTQGDPTDPCSPEALAKAGSHAGIPDPCDAHAGGSNELIDEEAFRVPAPPRGPDQKPELFAPIYKKVGVGQTIHFATTAIDQDLDETRTELVKKPASATWDAITQTVSWTPTKADLGKQEFVVKVSQPATKFEQSTTWTIDVTAGKQVLPVAEQKSAIIETVLMIRQPKRLALVNKDWPLDKMLLTAAQGFKVQFPADKAAGLANDVLTKEELFEQFLQQFSVTHNSNRLNPRSPEFDKAVFGDPSAWKIVAFRPRIDRGWTELRVVYQAVKAPEPVFAMFRIRPVTEYVPALPRPPEEQALNNKVFLGMVAKYFLPKGGPSEAFLKDQAAHGKAVAAFMNEFMDYRDPSQPYAKTFAIGIATEARMGGGSTRNPDGSYKAGDAWAWSAQKPFLTPAADTQAYTNVIIPGFWTAVAPSPDGTRWVPTCGPRWTKGSSTFASGHDILCRKALGFVDLPEYAAGKVRGARIDSNHLYVDHKNFLMQQDFPLDDGRRDVGEENGITCSQCHIRNFGMHDYADKANTDPRAGVPKTRNKKIATLNFVITPTTHWEEFTLEFLKHQECRAKENYAKWLPDQGTKLTCPFTAAVATAKN